MSPSGKKRIAALLVLATLAGTLTPGLVSLWQTPASYSNWCDAGPLNAFPKDDEPRLIKLRVPRTDAWTRLEDAWVGMAFVRRSADTELAVLNARDGAYFAPVRYDSESRSYQSVCYPIRFDTQGHAVTSNQQAFSPNMRMNPLDFRVANNRLWIRPEE